MSDVDDFFSDLAPVSKRKPQPQEHPVAGEAEEAKATKATTAPSMGDNDDDAPPPSSSSSSSRPASAATATSSQAKKEEEAVPPAVAAPSSKKPAAAAETKPPGPPMGTQRRLAIPSVTPAAPSEEVEALLRKFAGGLQRVLEGISGYERKRS